MTRVKGVVNRSIKVHIHDVRPGDVLASTDTERDPIIYHVERDGEKVKLHYLPRRECDHMPNESLWLDPEIGAHVFVHDLMRERFEYIPEEG